MPVTWDAAMFARMYDSAGVHYSRAFFGDLNAIDHRAATVQAHSEGPVLVVGCGYGFLVERLMERGVKATGIDCSPYIHATKDTESRVDVIDADVSQVRGYWPCVVTEYVVESYDDSELPEFLESCDGVGEMVLHFVAQLPLMEPLHGRDLAWYETQRPDHVWVMM